MKFTGWLQTYTLNPLSQMFCTGLHLYIIYLINHSFFYPNPLPALIFLIKNAKAINNYITPTTMNAIDKNKFFPPNGPEVESTIFLAPAKV